MPTYVKLEVAGSYSATLHSALRHNSASLPFYTAHTTPLLASDSCLNLSLQPAVINTLHKLADFK